MKPQNIGFTADGQLKLFDFGLVTCVKRSSMANDTFAMTGFTGTLSYMAPEVALRLPYNEKVDIYAFGIILWQVLSGEMPFPGITREDYAEKVGIQGLRPSVEILEEKGVPEGIIKLIESCWSADPTLRPRSSEILLVLGKEFKIGLVKPRILKFLFKWTRRVFASGSGTRFIPVISHSPVGSRKVAAIGTASISSSENREAQYAITADLS